MTGGWRKMFNEELHNFCSSLSIIRMIKSRRMIGARNVARMGRKMDIAYWLESRKEGHDWECQNVDGSIILKWILERSEGMYRVYLADDRGQWKALGNDSPVLIKS
jgi:hypothetical protein